MENENPRMLILLRHGEPDPQEGLTQKGVQEIQRVAKTLVTQGWLPDLIVSSHPLRAQKTTQTLTDEFVKAVSTVNHDLLNVATEDFCVRGFLSGLSQDAGVVLLSGHGETIAAFLNDLLDDKNSARLFSCVPDDRTIKTPGASSSVISLMPRTADGVVLIEDNHVQTGWKFHGYIADGNVIQTKPDGQMPSGIKTSNSFLLSYRLM